AGLGAPGTARRVPHRARGASVGHGRGVHARHPGGVDETGPPRLRRARRGAILVRRAHVPGGGGRGLLRHARFVGAGGAASVNVGRVRVVSLPCHACGLLHRHSSPAHGLFCTRCGAALHERKKDSVARAWALLIAAYVLIVPANVLPVMVSGSLFGSEKDTIMSGVVYLWNDGSLPLALILFIASVSV